jgi:uncharacterized protein YkwD
MRKSVFFIIITTFFFSACQKTVELPVSSPNVISETTALTKPTEAIQTMSITPAVEPTVTIPPTVKPTSAEKPTERPTDESTERPTEQPTVKPTQTPTPQQTPVPTAEPTPEPQSEITPVSSSYINAAMSEINRLREENGVSPATFSSSISSSCKSHAIKMAESGEPFHASGVYMFEAVGRASRHMSGATMGGAAANHVVQLQSAEVTKIGIGAVYCGDYVYYVVRGD